MIRRQLPAAAGFVLIGALGLVYALTRIRIGFSFYDDEGFLLISLDRFVGGGNLYSDVYSQYGPLYHEVFGGFFAMTGIAPGHDAGRTITALLWVFTGTTAGLAVAAATGRALLGLVAQAAALAILSFLAAEPMHPIGLTTLLATLLLATIAVPQLKLRTAATAAGALAGALLMVKINIGGAAIAGLLAAGLLGAAGRDRRPAIAATALLAAMTVGLLLPDADTGWVRAFGLALLCGLGAVLITCWPAERLLPDAPRLGMRALAAATIAIVLIALPVLVLGTPPGDLVHGILIAPIGQPGLALGKLTWAAAMPVACVAAPAAALAARVGGHRRGDLLLARGAARLAIALGLLVSVCGLVPGVSLPEANRLLPAMLLAWVAVAAPAELELELDRETRWRRVALVLVALCLCVQLYPTAGPSPIRASGLSFVIVAGLIGADGIGLLARWPVPARPSLERLARVGAPAIVCAALALLVVRGLVQPLRDARTGTDQTVALRLAGAERVRVQPAEKRDFHELVDAIEGCDELVSVPGLNSFYLWSSKQPPTGQNTGTWMYLLDDDHQQEVVDAISDVPDLCVLRNDDALDFYRLLSKNDRVPDRPLYRYLKNLRTTPVVRVDSGQRFGKLVLERRAD